MKAKNFFMPAGIVVGAIVVAFLLTLTRSKPPKKPIEIKATLVETLAVIPEDVQFKVVTQGTVKPRTESTLVAEVSGVITAVAENYEVGGYFKKGEMLMQIAPIDYEIALQQAEARHAADKARLAQEKARVKQAEQEWALTGRAKKDAPALALRIPNLQEAEANANASAADLKNAQLKLARTTIRAPYDGIVKTRMVDIGQYVNIGTQLTQTFAVDYAEVRLPLTNSDIQFLDLPQPGKAMETIIPVKLTTTVGNQEHSWQGKLARTEGLIDAKSRVHYGVVQIDDPYGFKIDNSETALTIGSFVKAEIMGISATGVLKIPRSAMKGADKLLVMDNDNKLNVKTVQITRSQGEWIYLDSGLEAGEKVILTALESAVTGMDLRDQHYQAPLEGSDEKSAAETQLATDEVSPLNQ